MWPDVLYTSVVKEQQISEINLNNNNFNNKGDKQHFSLANGRRFGRKIWIYYEYRQLIYQMTNETNQ